MPISTKYLTDSLDDLITAICQALPVRSISNVVGFNEFAGKTKRVERLFVEAILSEIFRRNGTIEVLRDEVNARLSTFDMKKFAREYIHTPVKEITIEGIKN